MDNLLSHPRFELARHDICFPLYVEVDQIFNLACPASPIYYQFDPVQTTKVGVHGAIHMLGLAKRVKAKILQASTSEVYGDVAAHPQTEDYWGNVNPIGLRSCYDEGKRCEETLFFDYRRQHKLSVKVATSSIRMVRACIQLTVAWCRISSFRRCATRTSQSMVRAGRLAPSAMLTTWSSGAHPLDGNRR